MYVSARHQLRSFFISDGTPVNQAPAPVILAANNLMSTQATEQTESAHGKV